MSVLPRICIVLRVHHLVPGAHVLHAVNSSLEYDNKDV